jgi:hypothetical protein
MNAKVDEYLQHVGKWQKELQKIQSGFSRERD